MQIKREAKIYLRKLPSGNTSYRVDLGKIHGKRVTKDFKTEAEAQHFASKANQDLAKRNLGALQDLVASERYAILAALEKLKPFEASITEAVDFFIKYAKPPKGTITVGEALKVFRSEKLKSNRTTRYVDAMEDSYLKPLKRAFPNHRLNEITQDEIKKFIHKGNRSPKTISNYIRSLNAFFNLFIRLGYLTLSPVAKLDRPVLTEASPSFLSVADAQKMLQYALDNELKAECASMVLVLFCGVRVEEVQKLSWDAINFETKKVTLEAGITKKRRKRINAISDNALLWLEQCKSEGKVASKNYVNRLRNIRQKSGVAYTQNAMRHSFASYHVCMFEDASKTSLMLGHTNAHLLFNTYRELVSPAEAEKYWEIIPKHIADQEEAKKAAEDAVLKKLIDFESDN